MIIKAFVARQQTHTEDLFWIVGAWDEWSIDENGEGFEEEYKKHAKEHGEGNLRVVNIEVPDGTMAKAFGVPTVEGKVV